MKATILCAGILAGMLAPSAGRADEFLALPGLWKTTYVVQETGNPSTPATASTGAPAGNIRITTKVTWHCVDESTDPWVSFAQLHDLSGMTCTRPSLEFKSTSLKWKTDCHGPGLPETADTIRTEGAIVFDSAQHYTGWIQFTGTLMGYPLQSTSRIEGSRQAACTSPSD
jgi:hypothetical protein